MLGTRYLMLMWADVDAAGGDESDMQAWVDYDKQVKAPVWAASWKAATSARMSTDSLKLV